MKEIPIWEKSNLSLEEAANQTPPVRSVYRAGIFYLTMAVISFLAVFMKLVV